MLSTGPIVARQPERRLQELLNEFYKAYFTGLPRISPQGDVTFPLCHLLFNQADLPSPLLDATTKEPTPQIHTVFTDWRTEESWWVSGGLATWAATLSNPASGVTYGRTTARQVEESVHGRSVRRLPGVDIRWRDNAGTLIEEVFDGAAWSATRTFSIGTSALRWQRVGGSYLEQANVSGVWTTVRTITTANNVWDGTKILIDVTAELSHFIRVAYPAGDLNKSDFLARTVAANLDELLRDDQARASLTRKGFRQLQHRSGPRPMPTQGFTTRLLVYAAKLQYYVPKEGQ